MSYILPSAPPGHITVPGTQGPHITMPRNLWMNEIDSRLLHDQEPAAIFCEAALGLSRGSACQTVGTAVVLQ